MDAKEEQDLKSRIDNLELDLQSLHKSLDRARGPDVMGLRKLSVHHSQVVPIKKTSLKKFVNYEELDQNPVCEQLQKINKNLVRGNVAIQKIASLTEISVLPMVCELPLSGGDFKFPGKKSPRLLRNVISESRINLKSSEFKKDIEREKAAKHDLQIENGCLKAKLETLQKESNQIIILKKKLKEEKLRRETAEALAAEYKIGMVKSASEPFEWKKKIEEMEEVLRKQKAEKEEMRNSIKVLEDKIETAKLEIEGLTESKRIAVGMAEEYRDRYEKIYAMRNTTSLCMKELQEKNIRLSKKLREMEKEQVFLQNELARVRADQKEKDNQCQKELQALIEHFKERAEKAEGDLLLKFNECSELKLRSPFSDPEVVDMMEKQSKSIADLTLELKNKESEYVTKLEECDEHLVEITQAHDKQIHELNENIQNLTLKHAENEELISSLQRENQKLLLENNSLNMKISEQVSKNNHQEALIKSLNETLTSNTCHIGILTADLEQLKNCNKKLEEEIEDLHNQLIANQVSYSTLQKEMAAESDKLKVKNKILDDQVDTIKTLRSTLEDTRSLLESERGLGDSLKLQIQRLEYQNGELQSWNEKLQKEVTEERRRKKDYEKHMQLLQDLEDKVRDKKLEWEKQLNDMSKERTQAMKIAKFATQKLVQAVSNYEKEILALKNHQDTMNQALHEKDEQLQMANQELEELTDEVWKSARRSQQVRDILQQKLRQGSETKSLSSIQYQPSSEPP